MSLHCFRHDNNVILELLYNKTVRLFCIHVCFFLNFILAAGLILSGTIGTTGSGVFINAFKLELKGMLRFAFVCTVISAVIGISFIAGCQEVQLAGLEVPYFGNNE